MTGWVHSVGNYSKGRFGSFRRPSRNGGAYVRVCVGAWLHVMHYVPWLGAEGDVAASLSHDPYPFLYDNNREHLNIRGQEGSLNSSTVICQRQAAAQQSSHDLSYSTLVDHSTYMLGPSKTTTFQGFILSAY